MSRELTTRELAAERDRLVFAPFGRCKQCMAAYPLSREGTCSFCRELWDEHYSWLPWWHRFMLWVLGIRRDGYA